MSAETKPDRLQALYEEEEARVANVVAWVSAAAILALIGIGAKAWHSDHVLHGQVLLFFALAMALNLGDYWLNRKRTRHKVALLITVALLFGYLVASGGESGTGPLWLYVFPPLVFYLTGLYTGLLLTGLCLALACAVFFLPELPFVTATYSADFKLRLLITLVFEGGFCFVLDYSRRSARQQLMSMAGRYERAARTDELTGLSNRRDVQEQLNKALSRHQRSKQPFSVILIDLDHFKAINDSFGHEAGDAVLKDFSAMLKRLCRETDIPARWGGEEFLILLPDTSLLQALVLADRLRVETQAREFTFNGTRLNVSMSAGVCSVTQHGTAASLLRQADLNLYEAKSSGRNRIVPRVKSSRETTSTPRAG